MSQNSNTGPYSANDGLQEALHNYIEAATALQVVWRRIEAAPVTNEAESDVVAAQWGPHLIEAGERAEAAWGALGTAIGTVVDTEAAAQFEKIVKAGGVAVEGREFFLELQECGAAINNRLGRVTYIMPGTPSKAEVMQEVARQNQQILDDLAAWRGR